MTKRYDQEIRNQSDDDWLDALNGKTKDYRAEAGTKQSRNVGNDFSEGTTSKKPAPIINSVECQKANTTPIASEATTSKHDDQGDDLLPPPLVKPGQYVGVCIGWGLRSFREGEDKLFFKIDTLIKNGEKVSLERWFNVEILANPKQGEGFKVGLRSACRREFIAIIPEASKWRVDRFYPSKLIGLKLKVRVRSTVYDMKREAIPEGAQYSVIEKILSIAEED